METLIRPFYKRTRFWVLSGTVFVLLGLIILCCVMVSRWDFPAEADPETFAEQGFILPAEADLEKNPFGPEDFVLENGYLTEISGKSVLGIDVSQFQGNIDWPQVKAEGVDFAMIRIGGRGTAQEGKLYFDDNFQKNYQGATDAGIQVGAYFFSQAISVEEALEEARYLLSQIEGWQITMPIVFDWEYIDDGRTSEISAPTIMACAKAFCDEIAAAGYTPMIYFNYRMLKNGFDLEQMKDYHFWLAMYDSKMDFPYRVDMWQYTDKGSVPGISGNVDMNLYFPREVE